MRTSYGLLIALLVACSDGNSDDRGPSAKGGAGSGGAPAAGASGLGGTGGASQHGTATGGMTGSTGGAGPTSSASGGAGGSDPQSDGSGGAIAAPAPCPDKVLNESQLVGTASALAALQGVTEITGDLTVSRTDATDLTALACLRKVEGILDVTFNPMLTTLHGLEGLSEVGSWIDVQNNDALVDATALANVQLGTTSITPYIDVSFNHVLERVAVGTHVAGHLHFDNNWELMSLAGLKGLKSVAGQFSLVGSQVSSLADLANLESVGGLFIQDNTQLPACEIQGFVDRLKAKGFMGDPQLANNGPEGVCN